MTAHVSTFALKSADIAQDEKARSTVEDTQAADEAEDGSFWVRVNGVKHDLMDLELDEEEEIENLVGGEVPFYELDLMDRKVLKAIGFVILKRDNPDITLAEAGKLHRKRMLQPDAE